MGTNDIKHIRGDKNIKNIFAFYVFFFCARSFISIFVCVCACKIQLEPMINSVLWTRLLTYQDGGKTYIDIKSNFVELFCNLVNVTIIIIYSTVQLFQKKVKRNEIELHKMWEFFRIQLNSNSNSTPHHHHLCCSSLLFFS